MIPAGRRSPFSCCESEILMKIVCYQCHKAESWHIRSSPGPARSITRDPEWTFSCTNKWQVSWLAAFYIQNCLPGFPVADIYHLYPRFIWTDTEKYISGSPLQLTVTRSRRHFPCFPFTPLWMECTLGVFHALAFAADFPPVAPEFYQRTHRVRLKNLGTTDKKSSRKIKHKKIPRVHICK